MGTEDLAVDISEITTRVGEIICPSCGILMLPSNNLAVDPSYRCPQCGIIQNTILNQMKHSRTISSVVTRERITEQESIIFDLVSEVSDLQQDEEEQNPMIQDAERDDEWMRRKGYKVTSL